MKIIPFTKNDEVEFIHTLGYTDLHYPNNIHINNDLTWIGKILVICHELIHVLILRIFPFKIATYLNMIYDLFDGTIYFDMDYLREVYRYYRQY